VRRGVIGERILCKKEQPSRVTATLQFNADPKAALAVG